MKNKFFFFITVCLFININYYDIKAEEFIFESSVIEITSDGNIIQAKMVLKFLQKIILKLQLKNLLMTKLN